MTHSLLDHSLAQSLTLSLNCQVKEQLMACTECCVCLEAPRACVLRPCNHLCVCATCAQVSFSRSFSLCRCHSVSLSLSCVTTSVHLAVSFSRSLSFTLLLFLCVCVSLSLLPPPLLCALLSFAIFTQITLEVCLPSHARAHTHTHYSVQNTCTSTLMHTYMHQELREGQGTCPLCRMPVHDVLSVYL